MESSKRGGKRRGSGRPVFSPRSHKESQRKRVEYTKDLEKSRHRISIEKTVYQTWKKLKSLCVYNSDTAFAKHLLSLELRRRKR